SKFENAERRLDAVEYWEVVEALGGDPIQLLKVRCNVRAGDGARPSHSLLAAPIAGRIPWNPRKHRRSVRLRRKTRTRAELRPDRHAVVAAHVGDRLRGRVHLVVVSCARKAGELGDIVVKPRRALR